MSLASGVDRFNITAPIYQYRVHGPLGKKIMHTPWL